MVKKESHQNQSNKEESTKFYELLIQSVWKSEVQFLMEEVDCLQKDTNRLKKECKKLQQFSKDQIDNKQKWIKRFKREEEINYGQKIKIKSLQWEIEKKKGMFKYYKEQSKHLGRTNSKNWKDLQETVCIKSHMPCM